jgi:hypothetical protein
MDTFPIPYGATVPLIKSATSGGRSSTAMIRGLTRRSRRIKEPASMTPSRNEASCAVAMRSYCGLSGTIRATHGHCSKCSKLHAPLQCVLCVLVQHHYNCCQIFSTTFRLLITRCRSSHHFRQTSRKRTTTIRTEDLLHFRETKSLSVLTLRTLKLATAVSDLRVWAFVMPCKGVQKKPVGRAQSCQRNGLRCDCWN